MCIFCDIVSGASNAQIVYEDNVTLAFLDHRPLFAGHSLLIPKEHHETLPDLPPELVEPFFSAARLLSEAIPAATDSVGSFVAINNKVSQSVPHLHAHVVPRRFKDGLRGFFWPRGSYDGDEEMERVATAIRAAIAGSQ